MCQYCCCDKRVDCGAIGEQIGINEIPIYILKYDNPYDSWYYFLVESQVFYYKNDQDVIIHRNKFKRIMPLNYCPDCGCLLV